MKIRKYLPNCGSRALFSIVGGTVLINPVFAQEPAADEVPEVIVTGLRASLETAQGIKLNADTFVDSITATDIGAFPDKSVAEALQRVPGITVSRLQSNDDSNHFSAEPATVLIRGLTFVRTEFNGRDSFSADGYRGLNFNDVSPELMQGVDTYKNQTAEMIEGGISGVVNLRTRTPFDSDGQQIALTGRANYGDLSEEPTYEVSGVYSNNWDTDGGRFGVLVNAAYSNILTRTEAVNMTRITTFCSDYPQAGGVYPNAVLDADGNVACNNNPFGGTGWRYAPGQVNFSQVDYDRTRTGAALTLQYENDAKNLQMALTGVYSKYENPWLERSANISWPAGAGFGTPVWAPFNAPAMRPITGNFAFGADGMLDSGVIGQPADVARVLRRHQRGEHQSRFRGAGPAVREWRGGLRWPVPHGIQREQRGAHLRPRRADAGFLVQREVGHHRKPAHAVRRAVHQGARPATTTSSWPPTASRRWTTRPTAMARR